jgi:ABC-type nitrate/sulfonate/bicarbonate transport system substrate-binding protein
MFSNIFTSWKSTLAGLIIGATQWSLLTPGDFTWHGLGTALPTIVLGAVLNDPKRQ